jgi:hypothetical protein
MTRHTLRNVAQITLRGLEPRLLAEVQRLARSKGVSMNKAALSILKQGAGIDESSETACIGKAVDRFVGSWTKVEAQQFSKSIRSLEQVDKEFWK